MDRDQEDLNVVSYFMRKFISPSIVKSGLIRKMYCNSPLLADLLADVLNKVRREPVVRSKTIFPLFIVGKKRFNIRLNVVKDIFIMIVQYSYLLVKVVLCIQYS